jgi:hypothetical protein
MISNGQVHFFLKSFSWWGGWLSSSKNKIVLSPKNWFAKTIIDAPGNLGWQLKQSAYLILRFSHAESPMDFYRNITGIKKGF